jgi:hypothetical protein
MSLLDRKIPPGRGGSGGGDLDIRRGIIACAVAYPVAPAVAAASDTANSSPIRTLRRRGRAVMCELGERRDTTPAGRWNMLAAKLGMSPITPITTEPANAATVEKGQQRP